MTVDSFTEKTGSFTAMSKSEANSFAGYPDADCENVHVTENGAVRTKIQAVFKSQSSFAVLTYTLPKSGEYIDLKIKTLANEPNVLYKLSFNTALSNNSDFIGQTAFGKESLIKNEKEVTFQKWCGLFDGESSFTVINNGTYAGSADNNILNLTLQRTPVYSAHPIRDRAITDNDRIHDHIDMGEREFDYRLLGNCESIDMEAEIFNQPPYALSFFPSGAGTKPETKIELSNKKILLSCYKRKEDGSILIRLFNTSENEETTKLSTSREEFQITFTPFEVKGFIYKNGNLKECNLIGE
jgi:alpha-mannosidase